MKKKIILVFFSIILLSCTLSGSFAISALRAAVGFLKTDIPLKYCIRVQFEKLPQFDEIRIQQLNTLLNHFEFAGTLDEYESSLTVRLDGKDCFTYTEMTHGDAIIRSLSSDPEKLYLLPDDSGWAKEDIGEFSALLNPVTRSIDGFLSLDSYRFFFSQLPSLFPGKSSSAAILERYRDYGDAVMKVSVVLTGNDLNEYFSNHKEDYAGMDFYPNPWDFVFENRQSFVLLFTEDGQLIKINYSGQARFREGDTRNIRIDWKTVRGDSLEKDEFELRTPNADGTRRDNFLLTYVWQMSDDGSEAVTWSAETDHVADGIRTRTFDNAELLTADRLLTGKCTETIASKGINTSTEIQFSISTPMDNTYSGTLEIISKKDKIEKDRIIFDFEFVSGNTAEVSAIQPEIHTFSEAEYASFRDQLFINLMYDILQLPAEDITFLKYGIPDEEWDKLSNDRYN